MPVADVVGESTAALMAAGLDGPTDQPAYDDGYGSWISTYAPIRDGAGEVVGAIGVDYPLEYVRQVRGDVAGRLLVMFAVIYAVLMAVVLVITTGVVRPLKRLNAAARRAADGEYDLDLTALVKTRFPDEMSELSSSFADMATRVAARERSLKTEVERLRVEVDEEAVRGGERDRRHRLLRRAHRQGRRPAQAHASRRLTGGRATRTAGKLML